MDEAEWMACESPTPMLQFLSDRASERKWRLFACACVRGVWHLLTTYHSRRAVEVGERYADGLADEYERRRARQSADFDCGGAASYPAIQAAKLCVSDWPGQSLVAEVCRRTAEAAGKREERKAHCAFLRDVFRPPPFSNTTLVPAWLTPNVEAVATTIYAERRFDDLPVLADALEDAGCADQVILDHLRGPGPHVRGCWSLDLVLGKE